MTDYQSLDPRAKIGWLLSRLILLAVLALVLVPLRIFLLTDNQIGGVASLWVDIAIALILLSQSANTLIYPFVEYRQWRYLISADKIELLHGIFWRKRVVIPISRIQHIELTEGPLDRLLGLANIELVTAGRDNKIPHLTRAIAGQICDELKAYINHKVQSGGNHE